MHMFKFKNEVEGHLLDAPEFGELLRLYAAFIATPRVAVDRDPMSDWERMMIVARVEAWCAIERHLYSHPHLRTAMSTELLEVSRKLNCAISFVRENPKYAAADQRDQIIEAAEWKATSLDPNAPESETALIINRLVGIATSISATYAERLYDAPKDEVWRALLLLKAGIDSGDMQPRRLGYNILHSLLEGEAKLPSKNDRQKRFKEYRVRRGEDTSVP